MITKIFFQKSGIYKITNLVNNKVYIGSSVNISRRITSHKNCLNKDKHCNQYLQKSWNKHGKENFIFEVIEYCNESELLLKEEYYMTYYNSNNNNYGYNIESFHKGRKRHSDEIKNKISKSHKGKKVIITQEWKINISLGNKGRKASEKQKENIRKAKIGVKRKSFSKEWKDNLSKSRRKLSVSVYNSLNKCIYDKITCQDCAKYLNVSVRYIYDCKKYNYKCKEFTLIFTNI